jgi:hypothetical protein
MSSGNCCLWPAVKVLSGFLKHSGSKIIQCYADESFDHLLSRLEGESFAAELVKIGEGVQQHEVHVLYPLHQSSPINAPLQLCPVRPLNLDWPL